MKTQTEIETTYAKCAELTRALVFAARGNHAMSSRLPMEVLAMHHLEGRLTYAVHAITYRAISNRARRNELDMFSEQLWADIARSRTAIIQAVEAMPSVCPKTRRPALMQALLQNPILRRGDIAAVANVSTETVGRWLDLLVWRGLLRRVYAGNIMVYFVAPLILAVIRQLHMHENRGLGSSTVKAVLDQQFKIAMDPYPPRNQVIGVTDFPYRRP